MQDQAKTLLHLLLVATLTPYTPAQKLPVLAASTSEAMITDGGQSPTKWSCDSKADPDIYYVNVPRKAGKVTFRTDKGELSFSTRFGHDYDFAMIVDGQGSCRVRISAIDDLHSVTLAQSRGSAPHTIPFVLKGSRLYFAGKLNGDKPVEIQLDLGAGIGTVSKAVSQRLALRFDSTTSISNTQGVADARTSLLNTLEIGDLQWKGLSFVEVGNMQPGEDLIIGNGLFRDKVIELDYDRKIMMIYEVKPAKAKSYRALPVFYEQNRPKFEATFRQADHTFSFWFVFDTGRDGTMLLGEDFTSQDDNWNKLEAFQMANGRKIVRLDATIGGQAFKDIVTNAADPAHPAGRPSLFGNQVLNHFNVILDNQKGMLYLKPNSRRDEPYSRYQPDQHLPKS